MNIDLSPALCPMPPGFDWLRQETERRRGRFIETRHHVIAYIPGKTKERLLVGFDNLASAGEMEQREPWAYGLAKAKGWGCLGVLIKRKDWFRCPTLWATMEQLRDEGLFASYDTVSMYGSSMGGFGAALFAPLAPGCTVLAMAPQSTLSREIAPFERRYPLAMSFADWSQGPMRDAAETIGAAGRAYVMYDPAVPEDRAHAERLQGPNVMHLPCRFMTHKLPPMFRRMGILKDLAHEGLTGALSRESFYKMLRKRREANPYILSLCGAAANAGHHLLAMRAVDGRLHKEPNWKLRQLRKSIRMELQARRRAAAAAAQGD